MSDLEFDEELHQYKLDGFVIPGVTSVIDPLISFSAPEHILRAARERGTLVHKLTERWDAGKWPLKLQLLAEEAGLWGYVQGWISFKRDFDVEVLESEQKVLNRQHRYAGTLDRIVKMRWKDPLAFGSGMKGKVKALLDIKTGGLYKEYGLQTAAYLNAYNKSKGYGIAGMPPKSDAVTHRFVVQLQANGMYKLVEHTNGADWSAFMGALALYNWRNSK